MPVHLHLRGFLVRQFAVQDVMTGINHESTTLSTKSEFYAHQVRLEDGDDGEEVGMCGDSLPRCTATPTIVLFFVFSLFGSED
ncbi:BQ5605_C004g02994 [Microbotryum silenes-dioicae]|uniref:BQ5605_C004g02994 protein n=1 Tax=Microbotryum silenes-dioicae TaxID=796604 RepID=A0A2X0N3G4_9BASI|nr:BQ5605_C004g02994 [Microbotryum silenes-dioicae]